MAKPYRLPVPSTGLFFANLTSPRRAAQLNGVEPMVGGPSLVDDFEWALWWRSLISETLLHHRIRMDDGNGNLP